MKYVLLVLVIFSCTQLKEGHICKKEIEPANSYTYMMPIKVGDVTTFVPVIIHDNEDYIIYVEGKEVKSGDIIIKKYYVSKGTYDESRIGDYICINANCHEEDFNNRKERK